MSQPHSSYALGCALGSGQATFKLRFRLRESSGRAAGELGAGRGASAPRLLYLDGVGRPGYDAEEGCAGEEEGE